MKQALVAVQNRLVIQFVTLGFRVRGHSDSLVRLGSDYGGWWIPHSIHNDSLKKKIVISAGLGFDVTFDEMLLLAGFEVIGLDPLQESVSNANRVLSKYKQFKAVNEGIWTVTGTKEFFPPKNVLHDSWSAINIHQASADSFREFPVTNFNDLVDRFPQIQQAEFVMLKMDIEGSEFEVLKKFDSFSRKVDFLAIELDFLSLIPFKSSIKRIQMMVSARSILRNLRSSDYLLVKTEKFNFFWIRR